MTAYLLDVNVLIALAWPDHVWHIPAEKWFAKNSAKGWATCPLVEAGFFRIVSNPSFSPRSVSVQEAVEGMRISQQHKAHRFWPDSITFSEAMGFLNAPAGHQ